MFITSLPITQTIKSESYYVSTTFGANVYFGQVLIHLTGALLLFIYFFNYTFW